MANGIVVPEGYNPPTPFDIYVYDMGREFATNTENTDVIVFHGSTDAPVVDVVEVGVGAGTIVDNLAYSDFAGYLELPTDDYYLEIRDETGTRDCCFLQRSVGNLRPLWAVDRSHCFRLPEPGCK
ncbi:MAG: DUF4397 domain-containing protein [Ignavibacteriales bacterium]|nr:DUF4397 domain-containing protein [Ignavibacteriales bacterium]